jgi:hypothetical protein
MFARCGGDCIHMRLAQASVSHPTATFSATARRPAKALEARMIEAVATSHIVGVPLSERVQRGTIGMAKAVTAGCSQHEPCYEYPPPHRARSSAGQGIVAGYTGTSEADISHCSMSALPSLRYAQDAGLPWTPRREFCLQ